MAENYFGKTDVGRLRDNNEDTFIAQQCDNGLILGAAIDGVGGYSGGEIASEMARGIIVDAFKQKEGNFLKILCDAVALANEKIAEERIRVKEHNKMACVLTAVAADTAKNTFYYAHLGDTRLYLFRDGGLVKISHDDSAVGFLEDSGRISEEEAMRHPKRNEINKALGFEKHAIDDDTFLEKGSSPFLPGDILLICSDGLTDMINQKKIVEILNTHDDLQIKATALIDAANNAGGKDNITVILIKNDKSQKEHIATKPESKLEINPDIKKNIQEEKPAELSTPSTVYPTQRKSFVWVAIALLIIGVATFLLLRPSKKIENIATPVQELAYTNVQKALTDGKSKTLIVQPFTNTLFLKDTLTVNRDSLHILGNGLTISGDSLYNSLGMVIDSTCHYLLLDSLIFKDFTVGILVKQKGLHLNKVQFINCKTPIIYKFLNTDTIADTIKEIKQRRK